MSTGSNVASELYRAEASARRRKTLAVAAVLVVIVCVSLCTTLSTPVFVSPVEVAQCYGLAAQQLVLGIFDPNAAPRTSDILAAHPMFSWIMTSLARTLVYVLAGFMLALAGALYQNVFRNPIASPSMLGVSSGIQLGVAVLICLFGTAAGAMLVERYAFSYIAVGITLVVLFGLSALMGGRRKERNVTNMLVVGVLINQFVGVIVTYITWFMFDDELLDIFMSLTTMVVPVSDPVSWAFLLVGFAVSVVPVLLVRFRLNAVAFPPEEMRLFGVRIGQLQLLALLCGTIGMVTAQVQVGTVAMITLVVPHISRAVFGAEFRKQFVGTMLIGAAVLVACHVIALAIPYSGEIPIGVVVNLVLLPGFVWLIATQQAKWD